MEEDNNLIAPTGLTDASKQIAPPLFSPDPTSVDLQAVPHTGNAKDDISKILAEIKLPERRTFAAQGDSKLPPKEVASVVPETVAEPAAVIKAPTAASEAMSTVMPLRTLRNDLQDVVRDNKMSMVKAVSLEQDKRREGPIDHAVVKTTFRHRRTWGTIFAIVMLFGLGVAALLGVYIITQKNAATTASQQPTQGILFAEKTVGLPIDGTTPDSLKRELVQAENSSTGAVGSIMRIVPVTSTTTSSGATTQTTVSLADFLKALGATPPDDLLRALDTNFFFGIHSVDKNSPVFVIPVTSYDHAFAAMLQWESTMNSDLSPVFVAVPRVKIDANGLPANRTFDDVIMNNYDVRALKDNSGTIQLYYSFPRPNILIIAESPYTFTEVLSRLQAGRKL